MENSSESSDLRANVFGFPSSFSSVRVGFGVSKGGRLVKSSCRNIRKNEDG